MAGDVPCFDQTVRFSRLLRWRRGGFPRSARPAGPGQVVEEAEGHRGEQEQEGEPLEVPVAACGVVDLGAGPGQVGGHEEAVEEGEGVDGDAPAAEGEEGLAGLVGAAWRGRCPSGAVPGAGR